MSNILIIDDDIEICDTMESLVGRLSHSCFSVQTIASGRKAINKHNFDVVFLDVLLPDGNGLDLLPEISEINDAPEVIILTGKGDPDGAELAIQAGVWDYILKPSSLREITLALERAIRYRQEKLANRQGEELVINNIIGKSPGMKAAIKLLGQAARSNSNLLITGETGTGKEVFARAIHENGGCCAEKIIVVDCASLTESLVESILFGHRKGAFTGAHDHQPGLIKLADKGTLFLDEIGEMPLSIQKSFLRVLQERTFRAVGDTKEQTSNFRLIAATNRDLDEMVETGGFRSDLLYRIKTMMILLPPLRQRTGDIKSLAEYKAAQLDRNYGMGQKLIDTDFLAILELYNWPGNVRELFSIIERAVIAAGSEKKLFGRHLPRILRIQVAKEQIRRMTGSETLEDMPGSESNSGVRKIGQDIFQDIFDRQLPTLKDFKGMAEKIYLSELIRQGNGDIGIILSGSGLSRSHFYALLKKHAMSIESG
jgi:two-component system NtrC family response regulator